MTQPRALSERACAGCGDRFLAKHARWCPPCRPGAWKTRKRTRIWTPEQDEYLRTHYDVRKKHAQTAIAAHFGYPLWAIRHRAKMLGLSRTKEPIWAPEQTAFVRAHVGRRTSHWIWKHLPPPRRTETAINLHIKRMDLSRRVTDGYTLAQLEAFFGISHRVIQRWAKARQLTVHTRGYANPARDAWMVSPADLLAFVRAHRGLYDLRRVDQPAFLALVFGDAPPAVAARYPYRRRKAA